MTGPVTFATPEMSHDLARLTAALSANRGAAPRRHRLMRTLHARSRELDPISDPPAGPTTWLIALPLEGAFSAVGLGFSAASRFPWSIKSASVYAADDFGEASRLGTSGGLHIVPAVRGQPTSGSPVFFDSNGDGTDDAAAHGHIRGFRIPANTYRPDDWAIPFRIARSDLVACEGVRRAEGPGHILFAFVCIDTNSCAGTGADLLGYSRDRAANRGRPIFTARADQTGDFTDCPGETTWSYFPFTPFYSIEYVSRRAGIQLMQTGDSLSVGHWSHSNAALRAAQDLSTPELPVELCNVAFGGGGRRVYLAMVEINSRAWPPSVLIVQPISRNDGVGLVPMQENMRANLRLCAEVAARHGSKVIMHNGNQQPGFAESPEALEAYLALCRFLEAMPAAGVSVIDCARALGEPARPWLYRPGMSDDGMHLSSAGHEQLAAFCRPVLNNAISGSALEHPSSS